MKFEKSLLALALAGVLTACGGSSGGGSDPDPEPPVPGVVDISVELAKRPVDERLTCYQGMGEETCNLRIYQVMVEAFIDGDTNFDYNTAYGNSHHKGDIQGIINSLDYIESLGMNAIWLTPVFQSNTSDARLNGTGYFAGDYFTVDNNFGTKEQLKTLVDEAHARGLYVFLDGVFGHHSGDVSASPENRMPTNGEDQGSGKQAVYPDDLDFYIEVATYWVKELKIDGWRLDQAYQVPAEHWEDIRTAVEAASATVTYTNNEGDEVNPLGYMVGEIWRSAGEIASQGYGTDANPALLSNFDFPTRYATVETFAVNEGGSGDRAATHLDTGMMSLLAYPEHAQPNLMIGNHDILRFGDLLQRGGLANPDEAEYWARHKAAFAFMAAYSGPITLYYNDEIGYEVPGFAQQVSNTTCADQGLCDDHVARSSGRIEGVSTLVGDTPVELTAEEADLKQYVADLMTIRAENPALYNGSRTHIHSDEYIYIDRKDAGDNNVLVMVNTKGVEANVTILGTAIGSDGQLVNLMSDAAVEIAAGEYAVTLPAFGTAFFDIVSPTAEGPSLGDGDNLVGEGPLADCDAPDAGEIGPLGVEMFIRGDYEGGNNYAATPDSHKFAYKGDNIYQVVVNEPRPASFGFKFADSDWSSEFAVENSGAVNIGTEQTMTPAAGAGTQSNIFVPEAGDYVYSFRINASNDGGELMVSKCE
ncbi:alpha-amylase family glycosyl hydrolase [Corallincola spongiicola]|uniref:Glycosidase n=1 Tax=Corallincola spongiicola TaxID=2520508 RepID=A0ABY1WS99_9GAMM|nr:alpha-amylase family glycosyl hydrolase [Corallincola spongiicola]TAA47574.1 glycosidase [Corallincola spongiicola]